ncbi:MAG: PilT/PilU family type 4a pilus ATPase [Enhygromyxa sp.]
MADLDRYLRYLQRDDVTELVLQTDKVAALKLSSGSMHPLTKSGLGSAHIVALLEGAGWGAAIPGQDTGGQAQLLTSNGVDYSCRIARRGGLLQVRVTARAGASAAVAPQSRPARPASPASPASPARSSSTEALLAEASASVEALRGSPSPARSSPRKTGEGEPSFASRAPRYTWQRGTPHERMLALLHEARDAGATDVHVLGGQPARLRRLGELLAIGDPLPAEALEPMLMPLLEQAGPGAREQLAELRYADFAIELPGAGRMRVNFAWGRSGLKGCFRCVVDSPPSLIGLGLPRELAKVAEYHQGLAVVSGPSGQGKTTTMAALVDLVNRQKPHHIITVEDPIEIVHPIHKAVISQRQVGLHTASFHRALKAALREDPDVIVIGELRDRETVEMALQAAETGHLVIASMSTPSGAKTIDRLIDMFPPEDQAQVRSTLAGALKIVVSQRLVPAADRSRMVAAAELITGNIPLWSLIRDNKLFQLSSLLQRGRNYGMIRVEDSLNELLAKGVIDEATARAAADDPRMIHPGGVKPPTSAESPGAAPSPGALGAVRGMFGRNRKENP